MDAKTAGYEHHFSFWIDEDILSVYNNYRLVPGSKTYVIEFRSNFMVKTKEGENQIIDSEIFTTDQCSKDCTIILLEPLLYYRLEEYWITQQEVAALEHKLEDFAAADPKYANRRVIPIVVKIDVCTVQKDDETIGEAHGRAIRAANLVPQSAYDLNRKSYDHEVVWFLDELKRYRILDVKEAEVCNICSMDPMFGAQMSVMPCCNHAFHSNCIFRWVLDKNTCPYCNSTPGAQDLD